MKSEVLCFMGRGERIAAGPLGPRNDEGAGRCTRRLRPARVKGRTDEDIGPYGVGFVEAEGAGG